MNKILTAILTTLLINLNYGMAQATNGEKPFEGGNGISVSENRLPELLRDVKVLLSDAFIADVLSDTLEVIYNLNRIFDLLTEADQYGEMDDEDKATEMLDDMWDVFTPIYQMLLIGEPLEEMDDEGKAKCIGILKENYTLGNR